MREQPKVSMWAEAKAWFAREAWPIIFPCIVIAGGVALFLSTCAAIVLALGVAEEVGPVLIKRVSSAIVEAVEPAPSSTPTRVVSDGPMNLLSCAKRIPLPQNIYGGISYDAMHDAPACFIFDGHVLEITQVKAGTIIEVRQ